MAVAAARQRWQRGSRASLQRKSRRRRRRQQHLASSVASAAALTINNQLKVATAVATETATMTATMMTMETKATAATCCCLCRRRRRQCRGIAKLPPPLPSWQLPTRCRRASAATAAFGRTAGDNKESSGRCNQQPPLPQRRFCRNRRWVRALPTIPPTPFRRFDA